MQVTLVKIQAVAKSRRSVQPLKRHQRDAAKLLIVQQQRKQQQPQEKCGKEKCSSQAAATRKRNARKKTASKRTRRTSAKKNTRSRASYKAAAKKAAATRKRNASKRRTAAKKAAATRRRNSSKRRTASKRRAVARRNPDVARRLPVVGKSKYAKMFDAEMKMSAHGAQTFKKAGLVQKAVQVSGGISGYGYGGTFTQMGHGFSENTLISSAAGGVTGLAGINLTSYAVNKVMGDMLLKGHEKKHHTNFTKGWRVRISRCRYQHGHQFANNALRSFLWRTLVLERYPW